MLDAIRKQSLLSTIIQILGAALGGLSTIFIYPKDLSLYGVYGFLTNAASLLVPFISLGFGAVLLRYYPYFKKDKEEANQLFGFVFGAYLLGICLFAILFFSLYPWIQSFINPSNDSIHGYLFYILPFSILYVIFELFSNIFVNFQKLAWPAFLVFLMKLLLPFLFILSVRKFISENQFIVLICIYYVLAILILYLRISKTEKFKIRIHPDVWNIAGRNQMIRFALLSLFGGASAIFALRIDSVLVTSFIGTHANGLFTLAVFISNVAFIPASALTDGLNAIVSGLSKDNDKNELLKIYSKSSINMLIPTVWISICIYTGFNYLSQLMPHPEEVFNIKLVLGWLLLARIVDAATGINHYMLAYSKYYVFELYLLVLMAVLNVAFNFALIPLMGISGAACATFLSICIYNLIKTIVVYRTIGLHPFSKAWVYLVLLTIACFGFLTQIQLNCNPLISLCLQAIMSSVLFLGLVYLFKISPDFNLILKKGMEKI